MTPPNVTQLAELEPMRVLEIEIARPLSPISLIHPNTGRRYSRALCLIRANTQPLGLLELKGDSSEISPDEYVPEIWQTLGPQIIEYLHENDLPPISTLAPSGLPPTDKLPKHLQKRQKLLANSPFVSVVIPTRERPEDVAKCLMAFSNLEYPQYEIIVVDNAPTTNATAEVVKEFRAWMPHLRYAREDLPGLSRGRNRGLKAARGEIVAYTDDDVVPDPHWLIEIVRGFQAGPNVAGVTGLTISAELDTPPQFWFEQFGGFNKGFSRRIYDLGEHRPPDHMFPYAAGTFGTGANMAFKTSFLKKLGGFDPAIGTGSIARSGGDLLVFAEVILRGYQLAYEPGALIYHSHRRHYEDLKKQIYNYGVGLTAYLTKCIINDPWRIFDMGRKLPYGLIHALNPNSAKNHKKGASYPSELTRIELWGLLYGPLAYLHSWWRCRCVVALSKKMVMIE